MDIKSLVAILMCCLLFAHNSYAIEESKVDKKKRTTLGMYFTAVEANDYMKKNGKNTLFLDVRDPAEVHTTGMPANADANVPIKRIDLKRWDLKKNKFHMRNNRRFVDDVAPRLVQKGLTKNDTIITICGSGTRAARAADKLAEAGYKKVYTVVDGIAGWQKAKLPWSKKLDLAKMYGDPGVPITGPMIYDTMDANKDGLVTKKEAEVRPDIIARWKIVDRDKDNKMSVDEYVLYETERSGIAPAEVEIPEVGAAPVEE